MDIKHHDPYTYHLHSNFAQLLALIRRGHYDDVKELLLAEPAVLKLRDRMGRSALHHCADSIPVSTSSIRPNVNADIGKLLIRMMPSMVEWQDNEGNIALHLAVINGDQALVKQLLRAMSVGQINIADYELHTAIHWCVVSGQLDTMTMALDHGADPSTPDIYGAYPLHYATQNFLETVNINGRMTPRQYVSTNFKSELISQQQQQPQQFLPKISTINANNNSGAISKRRAKSLRILHQLLTRPQIDVNCVDNERRTPLIWAASSGNHDALLVLVKAGAEISQQDKDGLSALHCASSRGHYSCVNTLITMCGADVHQLDSGGCTPLFYAVALGHPDCVRLLIKSGARLDHQDHKGRTAAHCGASKGQLETLKILHENGANLWLKNVRGDLPLHEAVKSGRVDLVKWLLDQSPKSVNEVNLYGRSPIHIAAFNHNLEMCRLLANYGADMNPVMKIRSQYLTPLDAALQNGTANDELIDYLRKHGAQSIAQIDSQLAEYMRKENDNQNFNLTETDEESKFNFSKKISSLKQQASSNFDVNFSKIKGRSRSKPREVKISEHQTMEEVKQRKSKSKPARFKDDVESEIFSSATTKLPNLVRQQKNGHYENNDREKRALSSKSASSSPVSSSPPNSVVHSATANGHHHHVHHHQYTDKVKNVREFETIIDGTGQETSDGQKHHPTHLKQAIITNVYLTAPAAATLAPVETTIANTATLATATGTAALLPIYYVKRVPPLKKLSSSSFVGQKRMKKLNGKTKKSRGMVSVLLESHDTFETGGQFREQRNLVQEELGMKEKTRKIDSIEHEDDDQEIEDQQVDHENDQLEREETDNVQKSQHETKSAEEEDLDKSSNIDDNAEVEPERPMVEERTPDSGFETEARKESLKDFYMNRKESFKSGGISAKPESLDAQDEINENKINGSEIESASDNDEEKRGDSSSTSEDESKKEKKPGWLGSKLETMAKSTSETINGTVSTIKDKLRFDSAGNEIKSIDEDEERRTKEVPEELIQRDFVQSFSKDDDDNDDDERRKRSVQLEPAFERQKSAESLQSVRSGATSFEEQPEQTEGEIDEGSKTEDGESVLIVMVKDERQEKDESSIVEVFDNETPGIEDSKETPHDKISDQTINEAGEYIDKLAPPLPEIDEFIVKKEIKFKGFDYDEDGDDDDHSTGKEDSIKPDQVDSTELKESEDSILDKGKSFISDGISSLKHGTVQVLDKVDEKLEGMEKTLGLGDNKSNDEATEAEVETGSVIQQSEPEPSAPVGEEDEEQETQDKKQDIDKETDQLVPIQRVRRGSYTKKSSLTVEDENVIQSQGDGYDFENNYDGGGSQENLNMNSSSNFQSSFGPVRQLKGKKKSYDHVRPKVNSYWSDEYHQQHVLHHQRKDRSPGLVSNSSKHGRYKHDKHHQYGSMGYLASTSHDDYSRIDPKIINQTVEKYLRKYYLERLLFEELYDLKRYQIRTGRTNEPQSVRRLVDRFRREMKAPGMTDFKGPYTYRAYEMYLYDLLRQLSRSNQKKIAYLTKSISYEDLASSFERLQAEAEGISSDEYRSRHRRHQHRDHSEGDYYYKTARLPPSDVSSETSEMNGGGHHDGDENRQSATTRHHIKFDPLSDYDRKPLGLVVDYKYEYHKSQHRAGDEHDGELVDVILENLYKRTGMHGNKMDEMAVSRKIVEKSGNEDNEDGNEDAVDEKSKQNARKYAKRHTAADTADGVATHDTAEKVWPDNDRNYQSYSRCSVYGHPGPSIDVNSREIKLARLTRTRQPTRKRRFIRRKYQISVPMDQIRKRWHRIKYQERNRHSRFINDTHSSSLDSDVTLWFELNQKWRPKMEIFEPY